RTTFNAREQLMDAPWEAHYGAFQRAQAAADDIGNASTSFSMEDLGFQADDRFLHNFMNSNNPADP
ncbi:hypothetical protein A2U01_0033915, partial [Trifolium medium]|nr:hypothetical protein [Trifolium medium]